MKWETVKLESVAEVIAGQSPESQYYNQSGDGFPFFQGKADFGYETPTVRYWCTKPTKIAKENDILLSVRAPVGPTNICNLESCIGRGLAAIRVGQNLNHRFLYWWFKSYEHKLSLMGNGSTFSAITTKDVKGLTVPLPPLPIQQQVADTLDKADALRRKDLELLEKYDELAQAVFYEMFGDIKSRTKNWDWTSLDSVLEDIVAGSSVGGEDKVLQNGELGVLKISAVTSGKFLKDEYKVPDQRLLPKNLIYPQKGDLLFSRANTRELVGATAIVESDCRNVFLPDKLWKLKPKPSVNSVFLKFVLSEPSIKYELTKTATGTSGSMLNISMTKLRSLNIPLPNIDIQDAFAARIKMLNQVIKNAHRIKKLSDGLFESLLTRIR